MSSSLRGRDLVPVALRSVWEHHAAGPLSYQGVQPLAIVVSTSSHDTIRYDDKRCQRRRVPALRIKRPNGHTSGLISRSTALIGVRKRVTFPRCRKYRPTAPVLTRRSYN
jgi:hypothetical protein